MPRRLAKPTDVPEWRRPFIDMLWRFFIAADRPSTQRVTETIEALDDDQRRGTANRETIRRHLRAESIGSWGTVEVIFLALCKMADIDPHDEEGDEGDRWNPPVAHIEKFHRYWNEAVDQSPMLDLPRTQTERAKQEAKAAERAAQNPWDEVPF